MSNLNEDLFGYIFNTARKKKLESEDKFREKIRGMSSSFEDAVADMISDLVVENIDKLVDTILKNDPHGLAAKNANILDMLMSNQKARAILEGAKKQRRYVRWNTHQILEAIVIILNEKSIDFDKHELEWLARNIHNVGQYLYS